MTRAAVRHRTRQGAALAALCLVAPLTAAAAPALAAPTTSTAGAEEPGTAEGDEPAPAAGRELHLDPNPGWGVGIEGLVGLSVESADSHANAHGLVGALLRLRYKYVEIGATYDHSDAVNDEYRTLGGFAGAYLPFTRWVDFDFAIGGSSRRYVSTDPRYGDGAGYALSLPALTLRAGVSDRTTDGLFGVRAGFHLQATADLGRQTVPFRYSVESTTRGAAPLVFTGDSTIGGFCLAMIFSVGLDLGVR